MGIRRRVGATLGLLGVGVLLSACLPAKPPPPPPPSQATDYSDGVIKLSSSAGLVDYFQPSEWRNDNANDADLGSTNPVFLTGNLVFAVGKQGQAFLLNASNLGQQGGELARMSLCFAIGGNATDGAGNVYVSCSGGVKKVAVNPNANPPTMSVAWSASVPASGPVTVGGGLVWSVDRSNGKLYGLNPSNGTPTVTDTLSLDGSQHFPTPFVSGTTVLVESGNHVAAFSTSASGPALWTSSALDGIVQSRPVVVGSTVVVATEHDTLYGLKLSDGTAAWAQPTSIGTAVPLSVIHNLGANCGNIDPLGVTSNLAVNGNTVFAVAEREQNPPGTTDPEHVLVAVDASTGNITVGPASVNPPGMNVPPQQQRAGLLAANGNIYVGFGGLAGDCGVYHGWVVAARQSDGAQVGSFEVATASPSNYAGAIWAPGGLAVDGSGNVYAATGNSFNWPP